MLKKGLARMIAWVVFNLAWSTSASAQLRETEDTRRSTAALLQRCEIPGGWVKVLLQRDGGLKTERSPSLTPEQNACIDIALGVSAGTANERVKIN